MNAVPSLPERRARLPWALVPVALLLSSALGVGSMAVIAARDPHFSTESDYYEKAVRWDQTQAQAATNQRLGYTLKGPPLVRLDQQGHAALELALEDRSGKPVSGANLTGNAFANAYSGELVRVAFEEVSPGHYLAKFPVRHRGQWVFELVCDADGQRFTSEVRADLVAGEAA
ncbi:MAG TPA: FixH family protein [Polyangiaceae bacterium]|nr:FixH family protein [Polyangiaceae bacterium]